MHVDLETYQVLQVSYKTLEHQTRVKLIITFLCEEVEIHHHELISSQILHVRLLLILSGRKPALLKHRQGNITTL